MKYIKVLGLAAVAAMAIMAIVGAGTASATVICKETPTGTNPAVCPAGKMYETNQEYHFEALDPVLTASSGEGVTCQKSNTTVKQTSTGSATATVLGSITALSFTNCHSTPSGFSCTVTASGLPFAGEIHWIEGTHDGTVTAFNGHAKVSCALGSLKCIFGATSLDLALTGGNPAHVSTNEAELEEETEEGFIECPESSKWDATYVATSPTAIYVAKE